MRIPYGIWEFKELRTKNFLYVDKTKYIKMLETIGEYIMFPRPRRFGKSLFTSMLPYYYDVKSSDLFNRLCGKDSNHGIGQKQRTKKYSELKKICAGICK